MDSKEKKDEDEDCPNPIKSENQNEKNISRINKILSDNNAEEKVFDLVFVIDATGSMSSYITAAKDETENISKELRSLYPEYNFQYGYVFYRDPIDSHDDIHEIINLTDQVNSLPEKIKKIRAYGGGDMPEDWVGAFKLVNENITWRNGLKVIIHLADAGAHGKEFTLSDKYPEESKKLKKELLKCCKNQVKIFGYVITEDARHSFNESQNYYRSNGGSYEICEFKINNKYYAESESDEEEDVKYKKGTKVKSKKIKIESEDDSDEDSDDSAKYKVKKSKKVKCRKVSSESESDEEKDVKSKKRKKVKSKKMKIESEDDSEEDYKEKKENKSKKKCKKRKICSDEKLEEDDEDNALSSQQKEINEKFRTKVIGSIKSIIP